MLFTVRNNAFSENTQKNIKIVKNKKYGIINELNDTYIVSDEYDNIFLYGINIFALYKNGKVGLCKIENGTANILCECKYDVIDNYNHDLFLSNDVETCYYNSITHQIMIFNEVDTDLSYVYGYDEKFQYIVEQETGTIIYKKKYTGYDKSYFAYCGESEKGAVFYDATFSTYLYPTDDGYKPYESPLNHPVIINKYNIINIMDRDNGLEIIDSSGNRIIDSENKTVKIELKITAVNDGEKVEKIIPIPKGVFETGKFSVIEDWI